MELGEVNESHFVEVHLFVHVEICNNTFQSVKFPKNYSFDKGSAHDIFYQIEKYDQVKKTYSPYFIGSSLPAYPSLDDQSYIDILRGHVHKIEGFANYWIPINQVHRVQFIANLKTEMKDPTMVKSDWMIIEKTPINYSIRKLSKILPE
ncbi:MAG: hypothetical protein EOP48_23050 [Sphingobacteriales bacterium]|nr:MAG: hypothetical protein EOP48_23050 [Sphingobacteriales bacterium]